LRTTIVAVAVACRRTISAGATDLREFPHRDGFSSHLFDMLPVEIDTFMTNKDISWPDCELVDLILTFATEGALRGYAVLLVGVLPHEFSGLPLLFVRGRLSSSSSYKRMGILSQFVLCCSESRA
jgi:hypothetical protein